MSANTSLRVTELDFFTIKENLKTFLRSQSTFTDYDFEGSGLSILLDVLAYNTYYNAFYLNVAANEAFLDTAQIRQNLLSHAKLVGYVPGSKRGSEAIINIQATPSGTEDNAVQNIVLDEFTRLLGYDIDGVNYPFVTLNANTATKTGGSFYFSNVIIQQGEVVTLQYLVDTTNPKRRFQIPSANVDLRTLAVSVQESASNTYTDQYILNTDVTELTSNSTVYFVEEDSDLKYTLYFGDGVIGKKPKDGNIVIVTYLDVAGDANGIKNFKFIDPIAGYFSDNVTITTSDSFGGADKETEEQIRFRAPYYYSTQNRAVTVNDYVTLIMKDYNNIDSVSVWGGEDNDPVVYGKVFISLKMKDYYALSEIEKETIKTELIANRNIVTVIPEIVDPDYIFVKIKGKVYYNPNKTSKSAGTLTQTAEAAIVDYNNNELNNFEGILSKFKIQEYIENSDTSITDMVLDITLQKNLIVTPSTTKTYEIKFNTPLRKGTINKSIYTFPEILVLDNAGNQVYVLFEEVPETLTGIASIDIVNPGVNYTSTPTVTITGDGTGATATAKIAGGRIESITVTNPGSNYTQALVSITGGGGSQATAVAILNNTVGRLRTIYYKSNGEKVIVNEYAGTVNYTTGRITLDSLSIISLAGSPYYQEDVLTISAVPEDDLILPLRNRILTIDTQLPQAIQLEVIPR